MTGKASAREHVKNFGQASGGGTIDTEKIYGVHRQIRELVEVHRKANLTVARIREELNENWLGEGRDEFEAQYRILIRKIEDFGDVLLEIYHALVEAETAYEDTDDDIRQDFVMAMEKF